MFHSLLNFLFVMVVAVANVGVGYMAAALMGRGPSRWRKERRLAWSGGISASSEAAVKEADVEDSGPSVPSEEEGLTADLSAGPPKDDVAIPESGKLTTELAELATLNMEAVRRFCVVLNEHHDNLSSYEIELEQHTEDEELEKLEECVERLKEIIQAYVSGRDQFVAELGACDIDDDMIDNLRNEIILASDIRTAEVCSALASLDESELKGKDSKDVYEQLSDETKNMNESVLVLRDQVEEAEVMLVKTAMNGIETT